MEFSQLSAVKHAQERSSHRMSMIDDALVPLSQERDKLALLLEGLASDI